MTGPLNGPGVRDAILTQGIRATKSAAYFLGNFTKGVQYFTTVSITRRLYTTVNSIG